MEYFGLKKVAVIYSQDKLGHYFSNRMGNKHDPVAGPLQISSTLDVLELSIAPDDTGKDSLRALTSVKGLKYRVIVIHCVPLLAKLVISQANKLGMLNGRYLTILFSQPIVITLLVLLMSPI
jgi:hypothetical protein